MLAITAFSYAYLEAIDFTETGEEDQPPSGAELTALSRCNALNSCSNFWFAYGQLIGNENASQAGHDFWLTRNGHGSGFWDRPEIYGDSLAKELTRASKACGAVWPEFEETEAE